MCGRYSLQASGAAVAEQFQLIEVPELTPRYNIAPTQPVAVVRASANGNTLHMLRWGLIPSWSKDSSASARMINARSETAAEKPSFRAAFKQRRCLIPANGFFEWQGKGRQKQPFYFQLDDSQLFAFAGLWEGWKGPDGLVETCTILTTSANDLLQPIHDRMPVIIDPANYGLWLDSSLHDPDPLQDLFQPYPAAAMRAYPVSTVVNKPANETPQCIAPLA
ncbi:MAG: SOS response-associated peptidase [Chloroflexales bacterium]|nr:SOS response-associated peptidase [Chloroflexales bacterium]